MEVPREDRNFTQLELCDLILNCIPYSLAIVCYAKQKLNYFVLSVKELMEELMLLESQFERNQKMLEQVRLQNGKFSGGESPSKKHKGNDGNLNSRKKQR